MSFNDVNYEPIECPYCGSKTVEVTIITSLYFKKVVRVYKNGIDYYNNANEESIKGMNEILGEPCFEPTIELTCFDCSSCKKHWISKMYKMVKGDNGLFSFIKNEDTGRRGKKRGTKTNGKEESEDAEIH